jgi:hypothetical protein
MRNHVLSRRPSAGSLYAAADPPLRFALACLFLASPLWILCGLCTLFFAATAHQTLPFLAYLPSDVAVLLHIFAFAVGITELLQGIGLALGSGLVCLFLLGRRWLRQMKHR